MRGSILAILAIASSWSLSTKVRADEGEIARSLLQQLDNRQFSERQAAFVKLCDPHWEIDTWLEEQVQSSDPNRAALCQWILRMRRIPGTMEERLSVVADYQTLLEGDLEVVSKYIDNRNIPGLVELIELLPESIRSEFMEFRSADNPFDQAIAAAWRDGCETLVPRLLNAILPDSPVRVGINGRWRDIGLPPSWHVDEPMDVPAIELAVLERDGRWEEALLVAKRHGLTEEYERLLVGNQRWEEWLELDPQQRAIGATGWGDVQRVFVLEALGRHDEAMVYYDLRKADTSKSKGGHLLQKTFMALFVGAWQDWEATVKASATEKWIDVLFLNNDVHGLFEAEKLTQHDTASIDKWFDDSIRAGRPLTKLIRMQSLFHRLGMKEQEDHLTSRIAAHVATNERDQQFQIWDGVLAEWAKYNMDEHRWARIAALCKSTEEEKPSNDVQLTQRGPRLAQNTPRAVTLETIFFKNFPNIRSAAYPLYMAIRRRDPGASIEECIATVEDVHQGRLPKGWNDGVISSVIRDMLQWTLSDSSQREPMLVDIADALDVMGRTEYAWSLLKDYGDSHLANLQTAQYALRLGRLDEAARLSRQIADRHPDDVSAFLLAAKCLAESRQFDLWLTLQKRSLSRMDAWEWIERYFQTTRRTVRMEPQPEILFLLELLGKHAPSTWHEIWFGDPYTQYGARIQADWYYRSIPQHPERIPLLYPIAMRNAMDEVRVAADSQAPDSAGTASTGTLDLDWSLWCMQVERCFAACFWQAVSTGDRELADRLLRRAHQVYPEQINTIIDVVPLVREQFGDETLRAWFDVYFQAMKVHLEQFPNDTLVANNAAWLAAKCGYELDLAFQFASHVVEQSPTDTYMDTLAEVEFVRGNVERAIEISTSCQQQRPRDPHHRRQIERFRKVLRESNQGS